MKLVMSFTVGLVLAATGTGAAQDPAAAQPAPRQQAGGNLQERLVPGMARYTSEVLFGDVYRRPELSPRDRSLVTISVLIATGKPDQVRTHLGRALGSGVEPRKASGVLTHLAVYSGWPGAVVALDVYDQVYTARDIETSALRDGGRAAAGAWLGRLPRADDRRAVRRNRAEVHGTHGRASPTLPSTRVGARQRRR